MKPSTMLLWWMSFLGFFLTGETVCSWEVSQPDVVHPWEGQCSQLVAIPLTFLTQSVFFSVVPGFRSSASSLTPGFYDSLSGALSISSC